MLLVYSPIWLYSLYELFKNILRKDDRMKSISLFILILFGYLFFLFIFIVGQLNYSPDCDAIMEWSYAEDKLSNYHDIGYGHAGVLNYIWHEAN